MQGFLDDMLSILPLVGLHAFEPAPAPSLGQHLLLLSASGVTATGCKSSQGFVVRAGSQAVPRSRPSSSRG